MSPWRRGKFILEALGFWLAVGIMRPFSPEAASNLGGFLGRTIGPRLGITRRARQNLRLAFPEKTSAEIETIVRGMWDNLGRVAAEYPHLGRITAANSDHIELVNIATVWAPRRGNDEKSHPYHRPLGACAAGGIVARKRRIEDRFSRF